MAEKYLRRICIALNGGSDEDNEERTERPEWIDAFADRLSREGIKVGLIHVGNGECIGPDEEGILWLTDDACMAERLLREGRAVIGWQRDTDEGVSFDTVRYVAQNPQELEGSYFEGVYRRYRDIPWDIAFTDDFLIRETATWDAEALLDMHGDPVTFRYLGPFCYGTARGLGSVVKECTEDVFVLGARDYINNYIKKMYDFYGYGMWSIVRDGLVIGRVGFTPPKERDISSPSLGYMISPKYRKKGLAVEASSAALDYAKNVLGFDRVAVKIDRENTASLNVAEKLGFIEDDTPKSEENDLYSSVYYGIKYL